MSATKVLASHATSGKSLTSGTFISSSMRQAQKERPHCSARLRLTEESQHRTQWTSEQHTALALVIILSESGTVSGILGRIRLRALLGKSGEIYFCLYLIPSVRDGVLSRCAADHTDGPAMEENSSKVPTMPGHRAASVSSSLEEGSRKTRGTPEKDGNPSTIFELVMP